MDLLGFAGWVLLIVFVVTAVWPLNVPLLALAYKVSLGGQKTPFETGELWWRSFLAGLGLAVLSLLFWFLAYLIVVGGELAEPQYRGAVHLVLLLIYVPTAAAFLFWAYAYDDLFGPIAVFALYILIPGLPLVAVCWLIRRLGTLYGLLP